MYYNYSVTIYPCVNLIQVPLGVLLFNENKLDEMSHILDHYMSLVPTVEVNGQILIPNGSIVDFDASRFFQVLFSGDQLTVARMRGVKALRVTETRRVDRFEGLEPIVADWHARMTLMKVNISSQMLILEYLFDTLTG